MDPWPSGESSPGVGPGAPPGGSISIQHQMQQRLWSSSRAGLGETGDALVVSRGSTAGASPRRRPELIPRSRATLLKAARGGSARAPQSASGPFKISILVRPMGRSRFLATRADDATRDAQPDAPEGPASSARCRGCCRSSGGAPRAFIPAPPIAIRPTEHHCGPPMTKPKPGLYPSRPTAPPSPLTNDRSRISNAGAPRGMRRSRWSNAGLNARGQERWPRTPRTTTWATGRWLRSFASFATGRG